MKNLTKLISFFLLLFLLSACRPESSVLPASSASESVSRHDTAVAEKSAFSSASSSSSAQEADTQVAPSASSDTLPEDGTYQTKDEVALYLHLYQHLPSNYITKKDAEKLGWEASACNLREVAPGKSIGGDRFGNREGLLPDAADRRYYECDIDYEGGARNAKRIVYSNDGLIFYTDDHYASFEQLY